jgi:hypothetical protein
MADPLFVEIKTPEGGEMLLNLDLAAGIVRQKDGGSIIVLLSGAQIPTGEDYATFKIEFMGQKE